jgi:hypothetical protein
MAAPSEAQWDVVRDQVSCLDAVANGIVAVANTEVGWHPISSCTGTDG